MMKFWMHTALARVILTFVGIFLSVSYENKALFFVFFVLYIEALFEYNWRKHAESKLETDREVRG